MESTREIYWNIGHGAVVPMYIISILAFLFCAWGFWKRAAVYRQGKSLDRLNDLPRRIMILLKNALGQTRVISVLPTGGFHALFFWGFGVLFIGTLLVMFQADLTQPLLGVVFLKGLFYKLYSLVLDVAGLIAIIMLLLLMIRRFLLKPKGLETIPDDYIVHSLLILILFSGFIIEGLRMAATELHNNPLLTIYSPVGLIFAKLFASQPEETLKTLHKTFWWGHFFLLTGFIAAIPHTKLRHIFTASANYLFTDLRPKGSIPSINLEDESIEQYGVANISDLTWKDIFDSDACTSCKRCQDRCPAYTTDKPLSPMKLIKKIGEVAEAVVDTHLVETIGEDSIWSCTTCRACQDICPASIEHVNKIIELRRNLTLMEGSFPADEVRTAIGNLEVNGNPFGMAFAARGDWAEGLNLAKLTEGEKADILYFVGCYASFDKRNREIAKSFVNICQAAGVKVGILGKDEKCCGEPARKLGNEYLYQMLAQENIKTIKATGITKIVTTCPHCFNTLSRDYKDLGFDLPVEHHASFIYMLIKEGKLKLNKKPLEVTYHDSCYLGRYKDIILEPRAVLESCGAKIREMEKTGYESFCCGAGGGRILAEEKLGTRIAEARLGMAKKASASYIVSNCPFCLTMFEDGIKTGGYEGRMVAKDLAEIVTSRIGG